MHDVIVAIAEGAVVGIAVVRFLAEFRHVQTLIDGLIVDIGEHLFVMDDIHKTNPQPY